MISAISSFCLRTSNMRKFVFFLCFFLCVSFFLSSFLPFFLSFFLVSCTRLYKSLCRSVVLSVCRSVGRSVPLCFLCFQAVYVGQQVCSSIHHALLFFSFFKLFKGREAHNGLFKRKCIMIQTAQRNAVFLHSVQHVSNNIFEVFLNIANF